MITVTGILGTASEPAIARRLHDLEHEDRVEVLFVERNDTLRRRLRGRTDKGTDIAIALDRSDQLSDGAVLLLNASRAIVVRMSEQRWLRIKPANPDAALEAGYCAGNHHWRVRFEPGALLVALDGPAEHYITRLQPLLAANRIEVADV